MRRHIKKPRPSLQQAKTSLRNGQHKSGSSRQQKRTWLGDARRRIRPQRGVRPRRASRVGSPFFSELPSRRPRRLGPFQPAVQNRTTATGPSCEPASVGGGRSGAGGVERSRG